MTDKDSSTRNTSIEKEEVITERRKEKTSPVRKEPPNQQEGTPKSPEDTPPPGKPDIDS